MAAPRTRVFATVFALSLTVLLLQTLLSRVFAGLVYNELYYFPLSLAMLGMCGGGVLLFVFEDRFPGDAETLVRSSLFRALLAAVVFVALVLGLRELLGLTIDASLAELAAAGPSQALDAAFLRSRLPLVLLYGIAGVLPFYFLGLALASLFRGYAGSVSRLYFFDLAGATLGAILAVPALDRLSGANYLLAAPLLIALALAVWDLRGRVALGVLAGVFAGVQIRDAPALEAPTLRALQMADEYDVVDSRWSATSYLQLLEGESRKWLVVQDHHSAVSGARYSPESRGCGLRTSRRTRACPVRPWIRVVTALRGVPESVCILAAGVGRQMLDAYRLDVPEIVGVEMSPVLLPYAAAARPDARLEEFVEETGVRYVVDEARHFMRRSRARYDLVLVPPSGSAKSTALPSHPNHLVTEEAIADYLEHLSDAGLLLLMPEAPWEPSAESVRSGFLSLVRRGLERAGRAKPEEHVLALRPGYLFVSARPFSVAEIARAARLAQRMGLQLASLPELESEQAPPRKPITDDYPFWLGASSFDQLARDLGWWLRSGDAPPTAGAVSSLASLVALALVLGVLLLPLAVTRRRSQRTGADASAVGFFFCLGAGFMFVEIPLMEKLVFALGHPIYSISFCLALLLASTGIGSLLGGRLLWNAERLRVDRLARCFALLIALQIALYLGLHPLLAATMDQPSGLQIAVVGLSIVPLGLLLGVPFPQGIALLHRQGRTSLVPWAWGANGGASVLAINLSVVFTRIVGISPMFLLAIACYGAAWALLRSGLLQRAGAGAGSPRGAGEPVQRSG